ncbi:hypothetical protein DB347_11345 [Opitutaceae bacterium EW11]|nr:hypothetical protein DB347_11345 [Opitutaceae bacterium EW11]
MHELQIAHGDPFPFNAALTGGECVWIDLNSTEPLDDLNAKLDVLAFFHFTYAGVLLSLDPPLHGVLADALDLFAEKKTDVLLRALARHAEAAAARVAANSAYDAVAVRLLQKNYAQVLEMWSGECGWSARVVFDHIRTYIAYLWNEGQSRSWEYNFALERKRHILAEAEYARTNRDRDRILELEKWGKSLLEAKDWHERRSQKLEQRAAEQEHVIDDLRGWAEKLKEGIQWHKEQLEYVQRESARLSVELDRSLADIAEKQRGIETQAAEIQEMRSGQHAIEARLQRAEDQAESTGHELERLTTENSILAEKVEALSRDNEVKRQEVSRLRDALNSTQERLGHESLLVQQCRESIKACGNKYAEASKKLASTSESYAASESKCRQLAERLASIESSLWWRIRVAATRVVPRAKEPNKNLP